MAQDIIGNQIKLDSLVEYQQGAIVSKEIIRKNTGTITLFAFGRGQGLSEHTVPFDAMAYVLDGKASIFISGTEHLLSKDEAIIMPANKPHSVKAKANFKMLLVMIKGPVDNKGA